MGQSQEAIIYDRALMEALGNTLSEARLAPYLAKAQGDLPYAYQLYLWNARLAKAFLYPLGVLEVAVRNSMHRAFSNTFGTSDWVLNPDQHYAYFNASTRGSHQTSMGRLLNAKGGVMPTADEMVAGLNFDYWSNLLRAEYNVLWVQGNTLVEAFPQMQPANQTIARQKISEINQLRNRIAHHEPVHHLDLGAKLSLLEEVMGFICTATRAWMKSCLTVQQTLRAVPSPLSGHPGAQLSSTNLRPPLTVELQASVTSLFALLASQRPQVALTYSEGGNAVLITLGQLASYLGRVAAENDQAILLTDETVEDLLAGSDPIIVADIDVRQSTGDAIAMFFPRGEPLNKRPQFLLVRSEGKIVGVIQNPIVKY